MKRFTETCKWQEQWFRKLPLRVKCLWSFMHDNCDSAGVIEPDWEIVGMLIGEQVCLEDVDFFGDRVVKLPSGKLWIRDFISLQCGKLSEDCRPHKAIIEKLQEHKILTLYEGYSKGINTLQEKEKDKDKEKEQEKDTGNFKAKANSVDEVIQFCITENLPTSDAEWFWYKCEANGWLNGKSKIKNWQATIRSWQRAGYLPSQKNGNGILATEKPHDDIPAEHLGEDPTELWKQRRLELEAGE